MKKFECECGIVDSDGLFLDGGNGWKDVPKDTYTWHCVECVGQKYDKRGKRIAELEAARTEFILLARKIDRGVWPDEVAEDEAMDAWGKVLALGVEI